MSQKPESTLQVAERAMIVYNKQKRLYPKPGFIKNRPIVCG